jgi:hypothetical protein
MPVIFQCLAPGCGFIYTEPGPCPRCRSHRAKVL